MKLKKKEYIIILIMAAAIFILLDSTMRTTPHEEQIFVPLDLERMNLDDSGRYLEPVFGDVDIKENMLYSTAQNEGGTERLAMDIYLPEGDTEKSRPLLIWVHGGGYSGGDKSGASAICNDFAKRGYVCASINYRLKTNPVADWNQTMIDTQTDTIAALDYLRENSGQYGIDKNRIFLAGDSAGGTIVLNTGFKDAPIAPDADRGGIIGVIDIYGSDLWQYADINDPPVLIIHGTNDNVVPYQASQVLASTLDSANHPYDFVTMYGTGHNYAGDYEEVLASMTYFMFNRLQYLNGSPFEYNQKTWPIAQNGTSTVTLLKSASWPDFKGTVKITSPQGWFVAGDTEVNGQDRLEYRVKPPETGLVDRMKLVYFDFMDETGGFVSRMTVPVQIINPVGTAVKKSDDGSERQTEVLISNLSQNSFTGGTVTASYMLDGKAHKSIQQFSHVESGAAVPVFFPDNLGERADFEIILNGGLLVNISKSFMSAGRAQSPVKIDGSLDEWTGKPLFILDRDPGVAGYDWKGKDDLSAACYVQWDETCFYLAADVTDDTHAQNETPENIAMGDSMQIALDPGANADESFGGYHELGFALSGDGTARVWRWTAPIGFDTGDLSAKVDLKIVRTGNRTVYEAAIPWSLIFNHSLTKPTIDLGFSFVLNDNDGSGKRGYMTYMGGIEDTKDKALFGLLTLR